MIRIQKACIQKDNKILILRRGSTAPRFPLHWDFPGGLVEVGESDKATITREVLEETGLVGTTVDKIYSCELDTMQSGNRDHSYTVWSFLPSSDTDSIIISWEHSEFRWVSREELVMLEPKQPFITQFLQNN